MKIKYTPSSVYFRVSCYETQEEQVFTTEAECVGWAQKVAHTFGETMSFELTRVTEKSAEIWADTDIGLIR